MVDPTQQPKQVTIDQALALARSHQFQGRLPEAESLLLQITAALPNRLDLQNELATLLGQQNKLTEALSLLHSITQLSPTFLPAWHNLAVAHERLGQYDQALSHLQRAVQIAPLDPDTRFRLAQSLKRAGQLDASLREIHHTLSLDPNHVEARGLLANFLLLHADFPRAWHEYEVRWQCPSFPDERRPWSDLSLSRDDLRHKKIVIVGEQGFGDMIQFSRYCPLLTDLGADLTTLVPTDLAPIISTIPHIGQVLSLKSPPPSDYLLPMMSLPRLFNTILNTIPAQVPYITPPASLVEKWRARVALATSNSQLATPQFKIGIAWSGRPEHKHDRERSLPLSLFTPISQLPNVTLFSLQKGPASAQSNPPPPGLHLINLTAGIADFADTASLIANLDLVISVDTAVAHLAGAMAKPVYTLLPHVPDWRWLLHRTDSPWYPTMTLFRQPHLNDWPSVFNQLESTLRTLIATHPNPSF